MAITKIQSNAFPASIDLSNIDLTLGADEVLTANIADNNVTHAKLHTDMDLSGKTVTLPALSQAVSITSPSDAEGIKLLGRSSDDIGQIKFYENDGTTGLARIDARTTKLDIASYSDLHLSAGGVATDSVVIKSSGNVGIGTANPSFGAGGFGLELAGAAGAGRPTIRVKDTVTGNALQLSATATAAILESRSDGMDLVLGTSGAEKFRIDDTSGYLVAQHQEQVRLVLGSVGNSNNNTSNWIRGNQSYLQYNSAASGHTWEINGAEKMRIHSDGNVGIGGTPTVNFEINKPSARIKLTDGTNQINFGLWDGSNYRLEGDANRKILITSYHSDGIHLGASGSTDFMVKDGRLAARQGNSSSGNLKQLTSGAVDLFPTLGKYLGYIGSGQTASIATLVGNTASTKNDTGVYYVMLRGATTALGIYLVTIGTAVDIYDGGIIVTDQHDNRGTNQVAAGYSASDHLFVTVTTIMRSNGNCYGTCHTVNMDQYGLITTGGAYPGCRSWAIHVHGGNKGSKTLWEA